MQMHSQISLGGPSVFATTMHRPISGPDQHRPHWCPWFMNRGKCLHPVVIQATVSSQLHDTNFQISFSDAHGYMCELHFDLVNGFVHSLIHLKCPKYLLCARHQGKSQRGAKQTETRYLASKNFYSACMEWWEKHDNYEPADPSWGATFLTSELCDSG